MIKINNLKKSFNNEIVLSNVTMHLEKGKIYGLIGSNGSGKTTLLKHIMSIYQGDEGEILYNGHTIENYAYREKIYYILDDLYFPYNYTLEDLFKYEQLLYPKMDEKKYDKLVTYFNLEKNKKLSTLSKGQKKQAAFTLAIASSVETLLLDEIVDGLDPVIRKKFWQVLMSEVMDRTLTVMISSHALTELDNICDSIGILHEGIIVKEDTIEKIKDDRKRIQFAVREPFTMPHSNQYEVIKDTLIGKVHFAILQGDAYAFEKDLKHFNDVLIFEILTMNLEEIFVSELGGLGYGNEEYKID